MKRKYSSEIVEFLLTNTKWSFWRSDWSDRVLVEWPEDINRNVFFDEIEKLVGKGFIYERSLADRPAQYKATKKGLIAIN